MAATVLTDAGRQGHVAEMLARGRNQWQAALVQEKTLQALRTVAANLPAGRIGILPPRDAGGPVMNLLQRSRFMTGAAASLGGRIPIRPAGRLAATVRRACRVFS